MDNKDFSGRKLTDVFKELEQILAPEAIIATNATTVIISELASGLKHQKDFGLLLLLLLHFLIQ